MRAARSSSPRAAGAGGPMGRSAELTSSAAAPDCSRSKSPARNDEMARAFSRMRIAPELCKYRHVESAKESGAIRKRRGGACLFAARYAHLAKSKKEAERRQTHWSYMPCCWHGRAPSRRRTSIGVPPRLCPRDCPPKGPTSGHASGDLAERRPVGIPLPGAGTNAVVAGVTRPHLSLVQRAPRGPVRNAGMLMPKAARERFTTPPAGTALAPLPRHVSGAGPFT